MIVLNPARHGRHARRRSLRHPGLIGWLLYADAALFVLCVIIGAATG